jgi:hypothetical protein
MENEKNCLRLLLPYIFNYFSATLPTVFKSTESKKIIGLRQGERGGAPGHLVEYSESFAACVRASGLQIEVSPLVKLFCFRLCISVRILNYFTAMYSL